MEEVWLSWEINTFRIDGMRYEHVIGIIIYVHASWTKTWFAGAMPWALILYVRIVVCKR